jgi:hypothetical protein
LIKIENSLKFSVSNSKYTNYCFIRTCNVKNKRRKAQGEGLRHKKGSKLAPVESYLQQLSRAHFHWAGMLGGSEAINKGSRQTG